MDPQRAGYFLVGARAFLKDPFLEEWEGYPREVLVNYVRSNFKGKDFEESVEKLEQFVKETLGNATIPTDLEGKIIVSEANKEQVRKIREQSKKDVGAYVDRLNKTYLPLAEASKQRPVEKKETSEEEQWQQTNEELTLKIQNQLISFDPSLSQDPELLEELTKEIKTGIVSLALTEDEAELEKKLKPIVSEVLTKNGYLINNEKLEEFAQELREASQEEIQEIKKTNDSPLPQEVLNLYAQNNENVAFLPAYVLTNPTLLAAYSKKALVALPVKFLQQASSETTPEWQRMLKEGVFVENYDLTIKNLIKSGLSENHPAIIKLQKERDRLYDAQKTPEGKDKPLVGLLKTFFKPNSLTGNQKGISETTGISLSGKSLWVSGKGWAFNLKNTLNKTGLVSNIYQKFPSLPGKTLVTSKISIGALAWSNRRLWRPVYLAVAKTAAGKAIKIGIKKASVWVATKLGLQAAITAAGFGTGVGAVPAIVINLAIEAVSFVYNKFIKPLLQKIKDNPLAAVAIGVGIVVIVPSLAVVGIIIAALGTFIALTGAGGILGGIAFTTVSFFTALVAGPVVGFSIVTAVIIGVIALSSLTFFIVMTTAGAFILPQGGSLRVPGAPVTASAPECASARHFAEEVVCQVQSCNIQYVTPSTITETENCLRKSSLTNKEIIISYFKSSVASYTNLQCVGFVQGVMAALGKPLEGRNAMVYVEKPVPAGYTFFTDINQIQIGDLAVDKHGDWGHIAIIVAKDGNTITVSNASGESGFIGNRIYPAPVFDGYLRAN